MLIRAFALNSNNKIELTLSELESLLNAAFEEGAEKERNKVFCWDYPYITCNTNTLSKDTVTLNSTPKVFTDSSAYTAAMQDNFTYRNANNGAINE